MTSVRSFAVAATLLLVTAPARADITAFIGANTTPANRQVRGVAVGAGFLIVAFEFEYAGAPDDEDSLSPALKTYSGNLLLQTPFAILGMQPYVTTGGGVYREELGERSETGFALNNGAGVKVNLAGPLRLRVDYRAFRLGSDALYSPAHRIYAGLNLKF